MGLNSSNKTISANQIDCAGSLRVTLALSASPDITLANRYSPYSGQIGQHGGKSAGQFEKRSQQIYRYN